MKKKKSKKINIFQRKHAPVQGFALGAVLVLFQSFWGTLALAGSLLMIICAFAFILSRAKSKH